MKKTATFREGFRTKKVSDGSIIMEGFANAATVDRGKELVKTDAWNLENYHKVGVILFNHDPDRPIGRMMDIKPTDKGLWIKARLSKSKDPMVSYVRDLVQEGILNAFSVGFDSKLEQKNSDGVLEIKDAELYEVSVVTLPMNQDSLFNLSSKSFKGLEYKDVKKKVLKEKGAMVAASLQEKIEELVAAGELDKDKLVQMVVESSGLDRETVMGVLTGEVVPVPAEAIESFAEILGLEAAKLSELDESDQAVEADAEKMDADAEKMEADAEKMDADADAEKMEEEAEVKNEEEKEEKTAEEEDMEEKAAEEEDMEEKAVSTDVGVIAIQIPKEAVEDAEAAAQWAKDNGWSAESVDENDNFYVIAQSDASSYSEGEASLDLGDGAMALVGVKKPSEKACDAEEEKMAEEKPEEEKMAEEKPEEEKMAEEDAEKKTKEAIPGAAPTEPLMDENPMWQQAKQTNVLLGALIQEIKTMSTKLDKIVVSEENEVEPEEEEMSEVDQKMLADAQKRLKDLKDRLSQYTI